MWWKVKCSVSLFLFFFFFFIFFENSYFSLIFFPLLFIAYVVSLFQICLNNHTYDYIHHFGCWLFPRREIQFDFEVASMPKVRDRNIREITIYVVWSPCRDIYSVGPLSCGFFSCQSTLNLFFRSHVILVKSHKK